MAENSKIEWTHHTFNPWIGCSKVHTGCANCYAENLMDHRYGKAQWGPHGTRVRTTAENWRKPLQWDRAAAKAGERHRVFCASLADVFENWDGDIVDAKGRQLMRTDIQGRITMDYMRRELFALIDATPHLDWLLLTKRPENIKRMWPRPDVEDGDPGRRNVWLGTSVSDQETANVAVPRLLASRDLVPVLFLSAEPIVGPVDLDPPLCEYHGAEFIQWDDDFCGSICTECADGDSTGEACFGNWLSDLDERIDWVIVGGESGQERRPMELDWARSIRDQCKEEEVAFFMKQIDKVQPIPDDLMIREFPVPA